MKHRLLITLCITLPLSVFAAETRKADEIISIITGSKESKAPAAERKDAPGKAEDRKAEDIKNEGSEPAGKKSLAAQEKEIAPVPAEKKEGTAQPKKSQKKKDAAPAASNVEQALLKSGIQFFEGGLYPQALQKFTEVLTQFPQGAYRDSARVWLGKINIRLYQYDTAVKELLQVGTDSAEYPPALFTIGDAYQMKGDPLRAIDQYQRLVALFPAHELADDALLRTGRLYLTQQKGGQALDAVARLVKYYGDRENVDSAFYLLGKIYETDPSLKDMETARRVYKLFLKKAQSGDSRFARSPLQDRVRRDLDRIERTYYKLEQ